MNATPYLDQIAARAAHENPSVLLWEVAQAFDEAPPDAACRTLPRARALHELVQFTKFDGIAPWLRDRRDTVQRACDFARRVGESKVVDILQAALDGRPQPKAQFSISLPGQPPQELPVDGGAATRFDGQDWGGTDIALSFAMDGFDAAVLRELLAARDAFELPPSRAVRERQQADARIEAHVADTGAAALFRQIVNAPRPRMEAGSWEAFERRDSAAARSFELTHLALPAASAAELQAQRKKFGAVADELLAVYALHDGAELFVHEGECGFRLASIEAWDVLLSEAVDWAENVTWNGEHDEIPPWLYTAIAFGAIPGDSERWLLITEGPHAGAVMLSDTDLIEDQPRFASFTRFMATLLDDAARVLNSGGHVRYRVGQEEFFPIRYRTG